MFRSVVLIVVSNWTIGDEKKNLYRNHYWVRKVWIEIVWSVQIEQKYKKKQKTWNRGWFGLLKNNNNEDSLLFIHILANKFTSKPNKNSDVPSIVL